MAYHGQEQVRERLRAKARVVKGQSDDLPLRPKSMPLMFVGGQGAQIQHLLHRGQTVNVHTQSLLQ